MNNMYNIMKLHNTVKTLSLLAGPMQMVKTMSSLFHEFIRYIYI